MTGQDFTDWMKLMGLNASQAAAALGVSRNSIPNYQKSESIPRTIMLACRALSYRLPDWRYAFD